MARDTDRPQINFIAEALKWQYNLIGLGGAAAFAVASGSELPLLLAAGMELIYLSVVPQMSRFQRLVRSWKFAEEQSVQVKKLSEIFHELPQDLRNRYVEVDRVSGVIRANYSRLSSTSQIFVRQMEERLSGLREGYVRLLHSLHLQRDYLDTTKPADIQREIGQLRGAIEKQTVKVREINQKRVEILEKRLEKYETIRENRQVIDAQCAAIEDVLELIRDQSVTMRDPQQVSDQLESLVQDVEHTEKSVREVEAIFEISSPDLAVGLPSLAQSSDPPRATPYRHSSRN